MMNKESLTEEQRKQLAVARTAKRLVAEVVAKLDHRFPCEVR